MVAPTPSITGENVMDRRSVFKILLGAAALAGTGAVMAGTSEAQAARLAPVGGLLPPTDAAQPQAAVATEADLEAARVESVQWRRSCVRRWDGVVVCRPVYVGRPVRRVVVVRRPVRTVVVRRPVRTVVVRRPVRVVRRRVYW